MKPPINKKLLELVNLLGLSVDRGEKILEQALKESRDSLRNHPAILAQLNRN